jgi:hypothetical protein
MAEPNVAKALQNEFIRAARECVAIGYHPTQFLQMLGELGPVTASIQLVIGNHEGFEQLWQLDRLDLSVEAIILREPYCNLFSDEVLERARQKLQEFDFQV